MRCINTREDEYPMNEVNEVKPLHFINEEHKLFYEQNILKCHASNDVYRRALFYCLGIDSNTRRHIKNLYDFSENFINPKGINCAWQTDSSRVVTRLAFNLYSNRTPTIANYDELDEAGRLAECLCYSVHNIFSECSDYFIYFIEAIKIRYS